MLPLQISQISNGQEPISEEKVLSIFDLILNGGVVSTLIIGLLLVMLSVALYIYFERSSAISSASKIDSNFMNLIREHIIVGRLDAAKLLCAQTNSPVSRMVSKGISRIGKPLDDIHKAIENAATLEVYKLEKNVAILATIAGAGPMIGFLGTVVGMIMAFHQMATSGGQAEMDVLAAGIYTAMTTTVAGLIVGIVSYIGYNHLVVKTNKVVHKMEATTVEFLDLLNDPI